MGFFDRILGREKPQSEPEEKDEDFEVSPEGPAPEGETGRGEQEGVEETSEQAGQETPSETEAETAASAPEDSEVPPQEAPEESGKQHEEEETISEGPAQNIEELEKKLPGDGDIEVKPGGPTEDDSEPSE